MWQEKLTNLSFEQFYRKIKDKRLIILYPRTTYRNIFLSYFLHDTPTSFIYYQIRTEENTIPLALNGLLSEWNGFEADIDLKSNVQDMALAFAKALQKLPKPCLIYLDELDHLEFSEDCKNFFLHFVKNLPVHCRLVVNSRRLSTDPWHELLLDGDAVVLGNEMRVNDLMLSTQDTKKPQLEIQGFGYGHAIVNGIEVEQWDGALPRNLFFYFVDKPLVTRDEIFKIFWPGLSVKEATNVYHVTKRKITEKLSVHRNGHGEIELTSYGGGFYRPSASLARHYDVAEFEADIEQASMTLDEDFQATLYRRAIALYKGPFLSSIEMDWVVERRAKLQELFLEALIGLARICKSSNQYDVSLGLFARALREAPFREDLHREVMQLYRDMNAPEEAHRQYHLLTGLLQDSLGLAPAPETQTLYRQIKI